MKRPKAEWGIPELVAETVKEGGSVEHKALDNHTTLVHFKFKSDMCTPEEMNHFATHAKKILPENALAIFTTDEVSIDVHRPPPSELDVRIDGTRFESIEALKQLYDQMTKGSVKGHVSITNCVVNGTAITEYQHQGLTAQAQEQVEAMRKTAAKTAPIPTVSTTEELKSLLPKELEEWVKQQKK